MTQKEAMESLVIIEQGCVRLRLTEAEKEKMYS